MTEIHNKEVSKRPCIAAPALLTGACLRLPRVLNCERTCRCWPSDSGGGLAASWPVSMLVATRRATRCWNCLKHVPNTISITTGHLYINNHLLWNYLISVQTSMFFCKKAICSGWFPVMQPGSFYVRILCPVSDHSFYSCFYLRVSSLLCLYLRVSS